MALEQDLIDLMNDTVTLEMRTGIDKFNKFTYGAPQEVKCYIVGKNRQVIDRQGRETISTVQVILAQPELPVTVDTRMTLPNGTKPAIIGLNYAKDEKGNPYYLEIQA